MTLYDLSSTLADLEHEFSIHWVLSSMSCYAVRFCGLRQLGEFQPLIKFTATSSAFRSFQPWIWSRLGSKHISKSSIPSLIYGCFGNTPNHPLKNRVFHELNHPFWGTRYPYFWFNTLMTPMLFVRQKIMFITRLASPGFKCRSQCAFGLGSRVLSQFRALAILLGNLGKIRIIRIHILYVNRR